MRGLFPEAFGVMRRFFLLGGGDVDRRIGRSGLAVAEAPPEHDDAGEDEGDGQELSHIQGHAGLEVDLDVLDEFHNKADTEQADHEDAENGAPFQFRQLFGIHPQ